MQTSTAITDIWSAISRLVVVARHSELVCLYKEGNVFKVAHAASVVPADVQELNTKAILHLVVSGKTTKCRLSAAEKQYFSDEVRRVNAWLN